MQPILDHFVCRILNAMMVIEWISVRSLIQFDLAKCCGAVQIHYTNILNEDINIADI